MKIIVSAKGSTQDAPVGQRFGLSPYFIIVNPQSMEFEAIPDPKAAGQRAAGMQAAVLAISKKVDAVLTGFYSPTAMKYLADNSIAIVAGIKGTVAEAVVQYSKQIHSTPLRNKDEPDIAGSTLMHALKGSGMQLINILPLFISAVLLIGIFNTFISKELLSSIFSTNVLLDTLCGAC